MFSKKQLGISIGIALWALAIAPAAQSVTLSLDLKVGNLEEVLVKTLFEEEASLGVSQSVDLSQEVNSKLEEVATLALRDSSMLDEQGRASIKITTPKILSIAVPEDTVMDLYAVVRDSSGIFRTIQTGDASGKTPSGQAQTHSIDVRAGSTSPQILMSNMSNCAFVTSLDLDLSISPTVPPQSTSLFIDYTLTNAL